MTLPALPASLQGELPGLIARICAGGALYLVGRWYFAYLWRLFIGRMIAGVLLFVVFILGLGFLTAPDYTLRILRQIENYAFGTFTKHAGGLVPTSLIPTGLIPSQLQDIPKSILNGAGVHSSAAPDQEE